MSERLVGRALIVAPKIGGTKMSDGSVLEADAQPAGFPSVMVDAIALELANKGELLLTEAAAIQFVMDAFGHPKAIGATPAAKPLLDKAGVEPDAGVPIDDVSCKRLDAVIGIASTKYARSPEVSVSVDDAFP